MRIDRVTAQNFRTLEDFEIAFDPHYCAISGRNNAGKSAVVSIIQHFLNDDDDYRYDPFDHAITFAKDATQWSNANEMTLTLRLTIDRSEDSETFFVIERFSDSQIVGQTASVTLSRVFSKDTGSKFGCDVNGVVLNPQNASEVLKKLSTSYNLVVHNSTRPERRIYYVSGSYTEILETNFSSEDRKKITDAQTRLENSVKKAAKQHKEELDKLLGMLNDAYQVELSSIAGGRSSKFPLEVKLTDRRVHVSLKDWGAGTQNRTRILISVLEAIRTRDSAKAENRTTPVFIVEEPESFLHPSAQAEFGQVLNSLAKQLNVQIIATTHSPYMLNQNNPSANYLVERKASRGIPKESSLRDTTGAEWMQPFAENLGIVPEEFASWKQLFGTQQANVVLVEGDIDRAYFDHLKTNNPAVYSIPDDVEVVAYGAKDALKNTSILQFMINKFGKVFITFDLDAEVEVSRALERIGLQKELDFCAVGMMAAGAECIEGLLPSAVKKTVYGNNVDLVTAMASQDATVRKHARAKLKQLQLEEFKSSTFSDKDLKGFKSLFDKIAAKFSQKPSFTPPRPAPPISPSPATAPDTAP